MKEYAMDLLDIKEKGNNEDVHIYQEKLGEIRNEPYTIY